MPAPLASDFSVLCLCGGSPTAVCAPGEVQYKLGRGTGAPQRRECGVCHGTGRIHREHAARAAIASSLFGWG